MEISKAELSKCKRAVVVLAEISKVSLKATGTEAPLELRDDMRTLTKIIRRLEAIAT